MSFSNVELPVETCVGSRLVTCTGLFVGQPIGRYVGMSEVTSACLLVCLSFPISCLLIFLPVSPSVGLSVCAVLSVLLPFYLLLHKSFILLL